MCDFSSSRENGPRSDVNACHITHRAARYQPSQQKGLTSTSPRWDIFFGKSTWSRVWAGNFNEIRNDTRSSGVVGAADKAKAVVTHSRQPEALIATPLPAFLADGIFFFHRYFFSRERHRNVSKWNRLVRALTWMSLADRLRREQEGGVVLHFGTVVVVTIRVTVRFCLRHSS